VENLAVFGLIVGIFAGFFGVGGGGVLVPLLMLSGYTIKEAVGISIIQMLFSSFFGSIINYKKGILEVKIVLIIAIGGFLGAFASAYWVPYVPNKVLEYIFFAFAILATLKLFVSPPALETPHKRSWIIVFIFGVVMGV